MGGNPCFAELDRAYSRASLDVSDAGSRCFDVYWSTTVASETCGAGKPKDIFMLLRRGRWYEKRYAGLERKYYKKPKSLRIFL
jgi:hypothetical protein